MHETSKLLNTMMSDAEAEVEDHERASWPTKLGPGILLATGFFCIDLAVAKGLTGAWSLLVLLAAFCIIISRNLERIDQLKRCTQSLELPALIGFGVEDVVAEVRRAKRQLSRRNGPRGLLKLARGRSWGRKLFTPRRIPQ